MADQSDFLHIYICATVLLCIENRTDGRCSGRAFYWPSRCSTDDEESKIASDLFIQIHDQRRAHLRRSSGHTFAPFRNVEQECAAKLARVGLRSVQDARPGSTERPGLGLGSGDVSGLTRKIRRTGLLHFAKQRRRRRRGSERIAFSVSPLEHFRRAISSYDLVHPHRAKRRLGHSAKTEKLPDPSE